MISRDNTRLNCHDGDDEAGGACDGVDCRVLEGALRDYVVAVRNDDDDDGSSELRACLSGRCGERLLGLMDV